MQDIKVLVTYSVSPELKKQIEAVSPRIKMLDAVELSHGDYRGEPAAKKKMDDILADTEIIFGQILTKGLPARAPKLKWIQLTSAGVDRFLNPELIKSNIVLNNVSGIHSTSIGEFVMEMMLMFVKRAPQCFEMKQKREWQRFNAAVLRGKTVGIVGLGNIGREVARLCKAFGMKVVATRRTAGQHSARNVDTLYLSSELPKLLADSDFVVLSLPLTPETNKLIGTKELHMMKPTAYLINIGRGPIIDEPALIKALEDEVIAGAGLDVFTTEPLPKDSRLWELPNVIYSPHVSGGMEDYTARATEVFCQNLKRYIEGKKFLNTVNKKAGY